MIESSEVDALWELEDRVSSLETGNRRFRVLCLAITVLTASLFAMGQASPAHKTLTAERFSVVDGQGRERAYLGLNKTGTVSLKLMGEGGKGLSELSVTKEGLPALVLEEPSGKGRVHFGMSDLKGATDLTFWFDRSRRLQLKTDKDGAPSMAMFDGSGETQTPSRPRAAIGLATSGAPYLKLQDRAGTTLWSKP